MDPTNLIDGFLLETADGPPIYVPIASLQSPSSGPSITDSMMAFIQREKPKVTVYFNSGLGTRVIQPFGDPGKSRWPTLKLAGTAVGVIGVALTVNSLLHIFAPRRG